MTATTEITPAQVRLDYAAIALLIEKIQSLDEEKKGDLMEVFMDLRTCTTQEEAQEVHQTLQEMLCPQIVGGLVIVEDADGENEKLATWSKAIGEKIKTFRNQRTMTQDDLASAAGLRQSHICRLERGQHSPSHKTLLALAKALNVSIAALDPSVDPEG